MGRPLNKKYFGTPTDAGSQIKVQYHNGSSSVKDGLLNKKVQRDLNAPTEQLHKFVY